MFKKYLPIFIILITGLKALAQSPEQLASPSTRPNSFGSALLAPCTGVANSGSTTRFKTTQSKTNDKRYLCLGDTLRIVQSGIVNLTEDPAPATTPGVAYLLYDCFPNITGNTTWGQLRTDACLTRRNFNGIAPTQGAWIARGTSQGNIDFINNGGLQQGFNNGAPVKFHFAPVTLYDFANSSGSFEGDSACIHVNGRDGVPSDTFSVVYLNAINVNNLFLNNSGGSFSVSGGLPEYDGTSLYSVEIVLSTDPTVRGTVTSGAVGSNGVVNFTVPRAGNYTITVRDGKSCEGIARAIFPNLTFAATNIQVNPGDPACVSVTATGFSNIVSFQFAIQFDPSVVRFVDIRNLNIPNNSVGQLYNFVSPNVILVSWSSSSPSGASVSSGGRLFDVCFTAIGPLGSISPIRFTDTLTTIEVYDASNTRYGTNLINGSVKIGSVNFAIAKSQNNILCNGQTTGRFMVRPSGGAPFRYLWQGSGSTANLSGAGTLQNGDSLVVNNLAAGRYYVTVVNVGNEIIRDSFIITQPNALFLNAPTTVNPTCSGDNNGRLTINTFGGGTAPYTFLWRPRGETTTSISNLSQGSYTCIITDANGCKDSVTASVGVTAISTNNVNITAATCQGINNGSIVIGGVSGGTTTGGNYNFRWSANANTAATTGTTASANNLGPGKYFLTITDANNCTYIDSFTVTSQRLLVLNANITPINCFGERTGAATVNLSALGSEALPYTFTWTGISGTPTNTSNSTRITGQGAGAYPLSIRDNNGCRLDSTITIRQPNAPIAITVVNQRDESCRTGADGLISISVTGGTPASTGYTYSWGNGATTASIQNLRAGNYTVSVTDSLCTTPVTRQFTINIPTPPIIDSIKVTNASCATNTDGKIRVYARTINSVVIDSIRWSSGSVIDSAVNLGAGRYYVTIYDSNGCKKVDSATVTAPPGIVIDTVRSTIKNPFCPKDENGEIIFVLTGGNPPYTFAWSKNGGMPELTGSPIFTRLTAGTYSFSITDANGCAPLVRTITLTDPESIQLRFSDIVAVKCYGNCTPGNGTGAATVVASGGTVNNGQYNFNWISNENASGTTLSRATQLCGGWQQVVVSDANCFNIDSVFIPSPQPFTFDDPIITQPTCNGDRDGAAEVRLRSGSGTAPYRYLWSTGASGNILVNVPANTYTVQITDANNCVFNYNVAITQPDSLKIVPVAAETNQVTCFGLSDGQITVTRTGGNEGTAVFTWADVSVNTNKRSNLVANSYSVTVTDAKGCTDSLVYNMTQPDPISFYFPPPAAPLCFGELTNFVLDTAFGGTYLHPFSVSVDNGPLYPIGAFIPLFAGQHQISVVEQVTGCTVDTTINISQPPAIIVRFDSVTNPNIAPRILVGLGDSLRLNPQVISALPIDSVSWSPRDYLTFTGNPLRPIVRPLDDRTYTLRVIDVNGCVGEGQVLVELDRNRNIFIPNVFSPNGDDKNDYFSVFGGVGVKAINYLRVYDRWGNLVFNKEKLDITGDASQGWDGSINNQAAPHGVYVFICEVIFEDGQRLLYRGDVTLVR